MGRSYVLKNNPLFSGMKVTQTLKGNISISVIKSGVVIRIEDETEEKLLELTKDELKALYYLITEND